MDESRPSTVEETRERSRGDRVPRAPHLFLAFECDRPAAGGARYSLADVDEVVVGRGTERCVLQEVSAGVRRLTVQAPASRLSGMHARIVRTEGGWVLEDAHSTNGSFVCGQSIHRAMVDEGSIIELGRVIFLLRPSMPTPPGTPAQIDSSELPDSTATLIPSAAHHLADLLHIARSPVPVLLFGETGTGKEVLARAVHALSERTGPFIAMNCGALTDNLLESQLFGHVRGAFSGAAKDEPGYFRAADGGTLLLDEIGDLPLASQPALLRVLQEKEVLPVGSVRGVKVDVRVVAATHRSLRQLGDDGQFRPDLLARLEGFSYTVPPLRERREDLGILIGAILEKARASGVPTSTVSPDAATAMFAHAWPENVRGLEQCLMRAAVLASGATVQLSHLPPAVARALDFEDPAADPSFIPPLSSDEAELRDRLVALLKRHRGNVADVARALGKARMQIHRWLRRFEVDPDVYRK
jgi:transcriptional regulator of acetoin/glycerol metabolism